MYYCWQNNLTNAIEEVQKKLQDAQERMGNNEDLKKAYQEALNSVSKSKEAITKQPNQSRPRW